MLWRNLLSLMLSVPQEKKPPKKKKNRCVAAPRCTPALQEKGQQLTFASFLHHLMTDFVHRYL